MFLLFPFLDFELFEFISFVLFINSFQNPVLLSLATSLISGLLGVTISPVFTSSPLYCTSPSGFRPPCPKENGTPFLMESLSFAEGGLDLDFEFCKIYTF